jgi:RNA polymerase sigma-70 factor, ECF subfamily
MLLEGRQLLDCFSDSKQTHYKMTATPLTETNEVLDTSIRDTELLARIARKDNAAFQELYHCYKALLIFTVHRVLEDFDDTQDVVQDLFVTIWQKAHLYESSKGKPSTWLTCMARNRAIDLIRSRQRRSSLNNRFELEQKASMPAFDGRSGDELLDLSERITMLRGAVNRLSDSQRSAIEDAFYNGKARKDMASDSAEPLGTVKARVRRGLKHLGALLERDLAR